MFSKATSEYCKEYTHEKIKGIDNKTKCERSGGDWDFDQDDLVSTLLSGLG
jgi:hypothetical protein